MKITAYNIAACGADLESEPALNASLHFRLRLPPALALLCLLDLQSGHFRGDVGHGTGDVASRATGGQSKKGELEPLQSFDVVLRDAVACRIEKPEVHLREYQALVGRALKPFGCIGTALLDTCAFSIACADVVLRGGVALIRGALEPHERSRVVLLDALALCEQGTEKILSGGVALFRERPP